MSTKAEFVLAQRIAEKLVSLDLLQTDRAQRFGEDLASGKLKREDWMLLADFPREVVEGTRDGK